MIRRVVAGLATAAVCLGMRPAQLAPARERVVERYPDGAVLSVAEFVDGRRDGVWRGWWPDGMPMFERGYINGLEEGDHRGWWPDGMPRFRYSYHLGLMEGEGLTWYPSGEQLTRLTYKAGHESGRQVMWNEDGSLRANYVVIDGRRFGLPGVKACTGAVPFRGPEA